MPVWLSFFIAAVVTVGALASLYFLIELVVGAWRVKASPQMGVVAGDVPGSLNVWVNWNPKQFAIEVYRLRFTHASPDSEIKEGTFTVTFDNALVAPFIQPVEFPPTFLSLIQRKSNERALFTVEFKTTEELTVCKTLSLFKMKKLFSGQDKAKVPSISDKRPLMKSDVASVLSLDFSELQVRRKRLKDLESAAKAKAAKAAAAPAAKPAAAATAAPVTTPTTAAPAPAAAPVAAPIAAPAATATAAVPKSVREVVSASNAKQVEKP